MNHFTPGYWLGFGLARPACFCSCKYFFLRGIMRWRSRGYHATSALFCRSDSTSMDLEPPLQYNALLEFCRGFEVAVEPSEEAGLVFTTTRKRFQNLKGYCQRPNTYQTSCCAISPLGSSFSINTRLDADTFPVEDYRVYECRYLFRSDSSSRAMMK